MASDVLRELGPGRTTTIDRDLTLSDAHAIVERLQELAPLLSRRIDAWVVTTPRIAVIVREHLR
jgi:hypothetical protein